MCSAACLHTQAKLLEPPRSAHNRRWNAKSTQPFKDEPLEKSHVRISHQNRNKECSWPSLTEAHASKMSHCKQVGPKVSNGKIWEIYPPKHRPHNNYGCVCDRKNPVRLGSPRNGLSPSTVELIAVQEALIKLTLGHLHRSLGKVSPMSTEQVEEHRREHRA